jgi:ribosomal protein S18 acetylase RimI-like enzyme
MSADGAAIGGGVRRAVAEDLSAVERIVVDAFTPYIPRAGRKPAVMSNDYAALIAAGAVFVRTAAPGEAAVAGLVVLRDEPDVLYIDTLAVDPAAHGKGHGRALLEFAAEEARRRGFPALRLCTNVVMTENIAFYSHLGWEETHRGTEAGFQRVFYRKAV